MAVGRRPRGLGGRYTAVGADVVNLGGGPEGPAADPAVLAVLALACRRGERVALAYTDARGNPSRRDVDPYRVVNAGRRWYLVAHDLRRDAWRTFRKDRVADAERLGGRVVFDDPPDAAAMVAEAVTTSVYRWAATVRLELPLRSAQRLIRPTVGQVSAESETTSLLRIGANDLDWLARYLVGLTCDLEVLDPPELVTALRDLGRELARGGPRVSMTGRPEPGPPRRR
jgi:predicted DNA-binding transcriptional regulator YafY